MGIPLSPQNPSQGKQELEIKVNYKGKTYGRHSCKIKPACVLLRYDDCRLCLLSIPHPRLAYIF